MYNPLLDSAPTEWKGCTLRTDFRQGLKFFRAASSKDFDEQEKAWIYIRCFFDLEKKRPPLDGVFEYIQWFVSGGEENTDKAGKRVFDFGVDSGRLYAAFFQVYNIDLKTASLHWWDFLELFKNLPDGTILNRVIEIRQKKPDKNDSVEYKRELAKAKASVRLDDEYEADLFGAWG